MRFSYAFLVFTFAASTALAQQQPQPTSLEQALGQRVIKEMQAGIDAEARVFDLQKMLSAERAKVKAIEDRFETKKDENNK